ncbi:MAG TPA: hypothetical protein DCL66_12905 [Gammaproteobacteria bacterium]|nr:hypothetical protein [Gammaproteobacteria bacterium]|tara:strand:+ start:1103 stop:1429 length:327 start_codon:yes stop_codon:yes gene_type:complete
MAYASDRLAYGVCDITGFRYRLRDMRKTWDGLLVGPDQWSPKSPQIMPKPPAVDPQALKDPRPDPSSNGNDFYANFLVYSTYKDGPLGTKLQTFAMSANVGTVGVTTT